MKARSRKRGGNRGSRKARKRGFQAEYIGYVLAISVVLFAFWIVFSFSVHPQELAVGAGCVLLAGGFAVFAESQEPTPFRPSLGDLLQGWRLPWNAITDSVAISLTLLRSLWGRRPAPLYRAVPFVAGNEDNPGDTARRVLAVAYTSVTPNSVVVGVDMRRSLLLYHQIERNPTPVLTRNLGARE